MKQAKTQTIVIRTTKEEKDIIQQASSAIGMNMSKYLTYLGTHSHPIKIEGGKELATAIYELNHTLNQLEKYPFVNVQKLRDTVTDGIIKINKAKEAIASVNPKI